MTELLNHEFLNDLKDIMEDEFPSLLETFLTESARQYEQAQTDWEANDLDGLMRSAHSLKGSSANIGAEMLQETCAALETNARNGTLDDIPQLLETVHVQLGDVHQALTQLK